MSIHLMKPWKEVMELIQISDPLVHEPLETTVVGLLKCEISTALTWQMM